ncbi:hypothetical protein ACOMHN_043047 [Nucella lapillus]
MSAPMKRVLDSTAEDSPPAKLRIRSPASVKDDKLENFMKWCTDNNFYISPKVCVERGRVCAQYGMVATEDITEGEVLFTIPRPSLLSPSTCSIAPVLQQATQEMGEESGWVPMLLALLHETSNPQSLWRPYLDLVPDFTHLDLPLMWTKKEREQLLKGTGVVEAVTRDLEMLERDFTTKALPFMRKHPHVFSPACHSLELYIKMVAFVMAYSFYEPSNSDDDDDENSDTEEAKGSSLPMMVPLADILNHVAKNNAALTFAVDSLHMMSVRDIKQGEEIYNTYGELSNKGLLHMYGFAQRCPDNHYDTVDIPVSVVTEAAKVDCDDAELMAAKLLFLQKQGLHQPGESYVAGQEGVLTDDELQAVLKVLVMSAEELKEHKEKEGWSDAESDGDNDDASPLSFEKMPGLPASWKKILHRCAEVCLSRLGGCGEQDARDMQREGGGMTPRTRYALYVRFGQRQLLQQLRDACG